ncbi:MAG: hypothetical protein HC835_15090 [Oscillatoriales cyanobacterium RM2_1_1]|nr:hypothetical protein [Oscillatoriales cyanobacterium SM2_3_0]NJO46836.1 hypothetical protein [Oscillatoriales cyanobacterium RM2_1_1]
MTLTLVPQNLNGDPDQAILRAIAQIVNHGRRSGLRVVTAKDRSRTYQIFTRPMVLKLPLS